jgi:PTS system mannose-specific IIC component
VTELLPLAMLGGLLGLDVVCFPQMMISRPLVGATVAGAFVGDTATGMLVGVTLELIALATLPFGASRYPEWGSASVVGGALFASQFSEPAGALTVSLLAALVTAMLSGKSMVWLRRLNATRARRERVKLERGSSSAVTSLQLFGLTGDLVRGFLVTLVAMAVFGAVIHPIVSTWGVDARLSRGAVVAMCAAVSAGAIWKIFHSVPRARLLFITGLAIGAFLLVTE